MGTKSLAVCVVLTILLSACASPTTPAVDVAPVPSQAGSTVPAEDAGFYPLSTRTGIVEVDIVLVAIESGDPQQMRDLLRFISVPCTQAEGLGGPPKCRDGEEEMSTVDVFPFLGSEGYYLYRENLEQWTGIDVKWIYAVYRVSENVYSDETFPAGEYGVLLLSETDFPATLLHTTDGQVVRIDTVFDVSPDGLKERLNKDSSELILAPK